MKRIKIGVAGLGRAFAVTAPAFQDARVEVVAGADPRTEARRKFETDFRAKTYAEVEDLCADPAVNVVYVATPHQFHAAHARLACSHGKHVLVEKPMALDAGGLPRDDRRCALGRRAPHRRAQP